MMELGALPVPLFAEALVAELAAARLTRRCHVVACRPVRAVRAEMPGIRVSTSPIVWPCHDLSPPFLINLECAKVWPQGARFLCRGRYPRVAGSFLGGGECGVQSQEAPRRCMDTSGRSSLPIAPTGPLPYETRPPRT